MLSKRKSQNSLLSKLNTVSTRTNFIEVTKCRTPEPGGFIDKFNSSPKSPLTTAEEIYNQVNDKLKDTFLTKSGHQKFLPSPCGSRNSPVLLRKSTKTTNSSINRVKHCEKNQKNQKRHRSIAYVLNNSRKSLLDKGRALDQIIKACENHGKNSGVDVNLKQKIGQIRVAARKQIKDLKVAGGIDEVLAYTPRQSHKNKPYRNLRF